MRPMGAWWKAKFDAQYLANQEGRAFAVVALPRSERAGAVWAMPARWALQSYQDDVALIVEPAAS